MATGVEELLDMLFEMIDEAKSMPLSSDKCIQNVPLVIISADRPAAWIGQMDGQTVPQPGVFQTLVKKSVNLPEIHTEEDEWYCNRLVNEALLETNHHGKGPVHINVPISCRNRIVFGICFILLGAAAIGLSFAVRNRAMVMYLEQGYRDFMPEFYGGTGFGLAASGVSVSRDIV